MKSTPQRVIARVICITLFLAFVVWIAKGEAPLPDAYADRLLALQGRGSSMDARFNCAAYICFAHKTPYCDAGRMFVGACSGQVIVADYADRRDIDQEQLQPGDVASWHGVHVAAYLGNGRWIDSDSRRGHVAIFSLSSKGRDPWFAGEVRILRWN
jgi:hypothetical protein